MALCHRLKVGLVAAAAAAGVLAGAGLADAAPMHSPGAPHGGHSTSRDVGVPGEVDSSAAAIAPDGTRINGVTAVPFGGHRTREGATPDSVRSLSVQGALQVDILARGARLRAWVPNGTVLGLAYPGQTAWGGCQIPGSDGWVWGWLSVKTAAGWRSGWMRHDLWSVSELTHPGVAAGVNDLPWC